jgi:hypothetical protein
MFENRIYKEAQKVLGHPREISFVCEKSKREVKEFSLVKMTYPREFQIPARKYAFLNFENKNGK